MMRTTPSLFACLALAACATNPVARGPVYLGDSERTMVAKMASQGARDVTSETPYEFYHAISLEQRYYWWEFPDKTIVAILVAAPPTSEKKVVVVETGDPGRGVKGIENWRSQKLKCESSLHTK